MQRERLTLKGWKQDQDLREITHLGLERKVKRLRIHDGEAMLFTNSTLSRARMIIVSDGLPLLVLFPAEAGYQVLSRLMIAALTWTARNCDGTRETAFTLAELLPDSVRVLRAA